MPPKEQNTDYAPLVSVNEAMTEHDVFKRDLAEFLDGVVDPSGSFTKKDMFPLVYSPHALAGHRSGGALWSDVTMHDRHYYIPANEAEIIGRNRAYLKQLFVERPTVYEFGPGDVFTLARKTMQILDAVDARRYIAVDVNEEFASKAAQHVSINKPDVATNFVCGDYTKPHKFNIDDTTSLGVFLGCSVNQHRSSNEARPGEVTFKEVLGNIGKMLGFNTILIVTTDANTSASSAIDCYSGGQVRAFLCNWLQTVMAYMAMDPDPANNFVLVNGRPFIDPTNLPVLSHPRYEARKGSANNGGRIVHSLVVLQPITIVINGRKFDIHPGTQMDIGSSEKWSLGTIKSEIKKSDDWTSIKTLDSSGSVQALVLAGKHTPEAQIARAKRQVKEWQVMRQPDYAQSASRSAVAFSRNRKIAAGKIAAGVHAP